MSDCIYFSINEYSSEIIYIILSISNCFTKNAIVVKINENYDIIKYYQNGIKIIKIAKKIFLWFLYILNAILFIRWKLFEYIIIVNLKFIYERYILLNIRLVLLSNSYIGENIRLLNIKYTINLNKISFFIYFKTFTFIKIN